MDGGGWQAQRREFYPRCPRNAFGILVVPGSVPQESRGCHTRAEMRPGSHSAPGVIAPRVGRLLARPGDFTVDEDCTQMGEDPPAQQAIDLPPKTPSKGLPFLLALSALSPRCL